MSAHFLHKYIGAKLVERRQITLKKIAIDKIPPPLGQSEHRYGMQVDRHIDPLPGRQGGRNTDCLGRPMAGLRVPCDDKQN